MNFKQFDLHRHLLQACSNAGFDTATPIQEKAIPEILAGQDLMACAQTGTGKTAAFVLPILHRLLHDTNNIQRGPKVVILSPTRELAQQILVAIRTFTKGTQIKTGMVVGGVGYGPQIKMLASPLDVLVATPGRLIDHMGDNRVDLTKVQTFVLDEADRMLDMGFVKPVETICETMPHSRQTLLFSATFSTGVERLAKRFLKNPSVIKLAQSHSEHKNITQSLFYANSREQKIDLLRDLLDDGKVWQTVVFIKTKHQADKMAKIIQDWGHRTAALHGDMRQTKRRRVIELMHENKVKVLVATDVAARGLDIKDLSHVINFDLPQVAEDYVHRIGRTGRAGAEGIAYSMVSRSEMSLLHAIEKFIGRKIEPAAAPSPASHAPKVQPVKRDIAESSKTRDFKGAGFKADGFKASKPSSGKKPNMKTLRVSDDKPSRSKDGFKSDGPKSGGLKSGGFKSGGSKWSDSKGSSPSRDFKGRGPKATGTSNTASPARKPKYDAELKALVAEPTGKDAKRSKPKNLPSNKKKRFSAKNGAPTGGTPRGEAKGGKKMAAKFSKSKGFKGKKPSFAKPSGKPSNTSRGARPSA